jgi:hypothetical protein
VPWDSCNGCESPPYLHTPRCGSLTFAEAMALDPSDVEFKGLGHDRTSLYPWQQNYGLARWREAQFRRARPRRSRVQEMAETFRDSDSPKSYDVAMATSIRAVCEYLRTQNTFAGSPGGFAAGIEREFLEVR